MTQTEDISRLNARPSSSSELTGALKLHDSWKAQLATEFERDSMKALKNFLVQEKKKGKKIFPAGEKYFAALDRTPFDQVRVVILGQDPYHGAGQAHGLCFSVPVGVRPPPSLMNIFKELRADVAVESPNHGNLEAWADQGVLLLNSVLTVEEGRAASHQGRGWEQFTDAVIRCINDQREGVAFLLWGAYAQKKAAFVDRKRHFVLESPHPSPLSAHRGFLGSKPFSKINNFLKSRDLPEINWQLENRQP